ncbi:hypothetical protein Cni_G27107 [Canna indica]|uniref:Uncharacterized protein n=1 Tax=Canna indica TaxID=4628 RepID=A0AAQ3QR43_9LILI|nr:hypothetical protein Cni_G27107 [Canna indica]
MAAACTLSESDPDIPCDFSFLPTRLPPAATCTAKDVFRRGNILPPHAPPKGTARTDRCCPRRVLESTGGSKTAEYQRLRSVAEGSDDPRGAHRKTTLPRSRVCCVLGAMRVPARMDMNEIKSRRRRGAGAVGGDVSRGTWKLLSLLSCKGIESAAVAPAWPRT